MVKQTAIKQTLEQMICTFSRRQISNAFTENHMTVYPQGMSKCLKFSKTVALSGTPTLSVGISPEGLYNRLNDAGRLILLEQNAALFGSAPFIRVHDQKGVPKYTMLTTRNPKLVEVPGDTAALASYYHPPVPEKKVSMSLATPTAQFEYDLNKIHVLRRLISPLLSGDREQILTPISVEEYEVTNTSRKTQTVTLVIPRLSLVNLTENRQKPTDQDTVYTGSTAVKGHKHKDFSSNGLRGVIMGSTETPDRMIMAVPDSLDDVMIDTQPYFCLHRLKQDLWLNADGTFYNKRGPEFNQDYGAAISLTFKLKPGKTKKIPVTFALDFPEQSYIDGKKFERPYIRNFTDRKNRPKDMAQMASEKYKDWLDITRKIQQRIFDNIINSRGYKNDEDAAWRLTRLTLNELSPILSNAAGWVQDKDGSQRARFLECFDYSYINPSDVDWYTPLMLTLFQDIEKELCQRFIDSINDENTNERWYHFADTDPVRRQFYEENPEELDKLSETKRMNTFAQIKIDGSVSHDVSRLADGNPWRGHRSDYRWYNDNYWVDLFPKLALRVLRDIKFTGDNELLTKNWKTLKKGFEYLMTLDRDGDGIPEGLPGGVKNTFDNLPLFGVDAYDTTIFMAGCKAMASLAERRKDNDAKQDYEGKFGVASEAFEKLWTKGKNTKGQTLEYYLTCRDSQTQKKNTDVWMNQLDALWFMLSIGEKPFISDDRARKILKTIYNNNKTTMGWAMCRTKNGGKVKSEQGQDVYTTSNYVFAQLLEYYSMVRESKEVYKAMDKVVFGYGNSLITPDNLRAEFEKKGGEKKPGPHYIVAGYARPGAIFARPILMEMKKYKNKEGYVTPAKCQQVNAKILKAA